MLSFIKTALVTIIISFISGVLLDYYRNYAPRIVCSMGRSKVIRKDGKKIKVYALTIRNISKKTIHNLNVNIAAKCDNLKLHNTKITNGLKFDITDEDNMFNITIPFLSPNDGLMTKIILEAEEENKERPIINLKSPESFKQIDSYNNKAEENDQRAIEKINNFFEKVFYKNRKIILGIVALAVLVFMGILVGEYYNNTTNSNNKLYQNAGSESTNTNSSSTTEGSSIDDSSDDENSAVNSENYNKEGNKQTDEGNLISNYPSPADKEDNGYNTSNSLEEEDLESTNSSENGTAIDTTTNNEDAISPEANTDNSNDTTSTTATIEDDGIIEGTTSDSGETENPGEVNGDTTSDGGTDANSTTGDTGTTSIPR